jgi:hypothetical protein
MEVRLGERMLLIPGITTINVTGSAGFKLRNNLGEIVDTVASSSPHIAMPAGDHTLNIRNRMVHFDPQEGQNFVVDSRQAVAWPPLPLQSSAILTDPVQPTLSFRQKTDREKSATKPQPECR